jgi:phage protein U
MAIAGILGPLPFLGGQGTAATFHTIKKKFEVRYAKHEIINGVDLIEATGFKPIDIDLDMIFFNPWTLPPSVALAIIEALAASRLPVPLMTADGTGFGRGLLTLFVIESVDSTMKKWCGGTNTYMTVTVKLLEYGNPFGIGGPLGALAGIGASVIGTIV